MNIDRRSLLEYAALAPFAGAFARVARPADEHADEAADYTLRIAYRPGRAGAGPHRFHDRSTTASFPGRCCASRKASGSIVDIHNDTDTPEQLHWHGQMIPVDVDGAAEEGTPYIPRARHAADRASRREPAGFRFYHTHVVAGADLHRGNTAARSGRSTSSRSTSPAPTTARYSWC